MSEYTTVYLRHKEMPLLKNKEYPSHEECQILSKEDLMEVICEIDEYNKQVAKSLGCKLFYLSTTPSRELTVLPYSPSPSVLTNILLEEVLCFYKEEIEHCKKAIAKNKEDIAKLEVRITKTTIDLYDKINKEIDNCYENIDFEEKIEWKEVKKEYLTLDEVKKLAATPCKIPVLKQASLFACMTGLRISDILKLDWRDFEVGPDQGYYIRICTEKTETEATLPISQEALELCGEWGTGKVFKGLTRSMTHHPLKQWIAEAGIRKHITFHCFRHSYAVIQISLGTDIYTVSKMLTHKNVTTTQIYADLVNSKKRETANKISLK